MNIETEAQAQKRLRDLITQVKRELNLDHHPHYSGIDDPIAKHLGLEVREVALDFDEGQYIPDRRLIVLDPRVSDSDRLNFTFFHEVSHHLIREDAFLYSFLNEYAQGDQELKRVVETYCNFGAAEFMIPIQDLRHFLTNHGFSIAHIEQLEEIYPASKIAIAIQMAHCATHQCYIVVCEYGLPPRRKEAQAPSNLLFENPQDSPGLYVCYTAQSPSITKYSIARHTRIPKEHIIAIAYQQRTYIKGRDAIPFRSQTRWEVDCEACFLKGKVFAVFNVSPPLLHSSQQLGLFDALSD